VRGALPIFGDALASVEDARERFLVEGGVQILRRDTIYAAILETPDYYARLVSPWKDVGRGLKLDAVLPMVLNDSYKLRSQSHQLMTDAQRCCDFVRHAEEQVMGSPLGLRRNSLKASDSRPHQGRWVPSMARDFFLGSSPWSWRQTRKLKWTCALIRLAMTMFGDGIRRSRRTKGSPNEFFASRLSGRAVHS
jgi:hypothetical protein